jgi:hypothetical protein
MWFPAPGKLAVNDGFGNVGVPPHPLSSGLISRPVSPESGPDVVQDPVRGGPQAGHGRSRCENFA